MVIGAVVECQAVVETLGFFGTSQVEGSWDGLNMNRS